MSCGRWDILPFMVKVNETSLRGQTKIKKRDSYSRTEEKEYKNSTDVLLIFLINFSLYL